MHRSFLIIIILIHSIALGSNFDSSSDLKCVKEYPVEIFSHKALSLTSVKFANNRSLSISPKSLTKVPYFNNDVMKREAERNGGCQFPPDLLLNDEPITPTIFLSQIMSVQYFPSDIAEIMELWQVRNFLSLDKTLYLTPLVDALIGKNFYGENFWKSLDLESSDPVSITKHNFYTHAASGKRYLADFKTKTVYDLY